MTISRERRAAAHRNLRKGKSDGIEDHARARAAAAGIAAHCRRPARITLRRRRYRKRPAKKLRRMHCASQRTLPELIRSSRDF